MATVVTSDSTPSPVVADRRGDDRVWGRVWWFCPDRGFGWVLDDRDHAFFTTWSDLPGRGFRWLEDGVAVSFRTDRDCHGPVARDVVVESAHRMAG